MRAECFASLQEFQRRWLALFHAVAQRDAAAMAQHASHLLASQTALGPEAREYLLLAAMAGHIAQGSPAVAAALWEVHGGALPTAANPVFRLLRCHAGPHTCIAAFSKHAKR